jgi:hypothetical protein
MKLSKHTKTPAVLSAALNTQCDFAPEVFYGCIRNEYRAFDFGIDLVLYKRSWYIIT